MLTQHGRLQQFRGVVGAVAVLVQEAVEGAHTAQYTALRTGIDAYVVQPGGKVLQVFQLYVQQVLVRLLQVVKQFQQVTLIGIQRIR